MVIRGLLLGLAIGLAGAGPAQAGEPSLTVGIDGKTLAYTRQALLENPAATEIDIPRDVSYLRAMHYRAVPLSAILADMKLAPDQVLEAVASDGFVALLPADLIIHPRPGEAEAFLAVEPRDAPWPSLPGKTAGAGPFYIVWRNPEASGIRSEQWPYMVVSLRSADSPAKEWPALGVDPALPAGDPIRAGQTLFVVQCMACHKMDGAGRADIAPDLNLPENPTEYFKPDALKRYIRDPASVRHWPAMRMQGFGKDSLSDREIDQIVAYLQYMAGRKAKP
jgi:mono/diheme cytochrome c family protein